MPKIAKSKELYGVRHSYPYYKGISDNPVSYMDYCKILKGYFNYLIDLILEGKEIELPLGMGSIYVKGRKEKPRIDAEGNIRGLAPDWVETKKLWLSNPEAEAKKKIIYCTNEHTNGIRYCFYWSRKEVSVENISFYSLRFIKEDKISLSKLIKSGKEYYVIPSIIL